jgi:hypothetical protein
MQKNSVRKILDWSEKYCDNYYDIVGIVALLPNGQTNYQWDRQVGDDTPPAKYWISVFKRKQ